MLLFSKTIFCENNLNIVFNKYFKNFPFYSIHILFWEFFHFDKLQNHLQNQRYLWKIVEYHTLIFLPRI